MRSWADTCGRFRLNVTVRLAIRSIPAMATEDSTPLPHAVPWRQVDLLLAANAKGAEALGLARRPRDDSQCVGCAG